MSVPVCRFLFRSAVCLFQVHVPNLLVIPRAIAKGRNSDRNICCSSPSHHSCIWTCILHHLVAFLFAVFIHQDWCKCLFVHPAFQPLFRPGVPPDSVPGTGFWILPSSKMLRGGENFATRKQLNREKKRKETKNESISGCGGFPLLPKRGKYCDIL